MSGAWPSRRVGLVIGLTLRHLSPRRRRPLGAVARVVVLGLVLAVASCGRTKEDIVTKARDISSRTELEKTLGRPDDITKLGPVETWRYQASNGDVVFVIVGDRVTLQAAGREEKK